MTVTDNKEWLEQQLIGFYHFKQMIDTYGSEEDKKLAVKPLVDRYLSDQIAMEKGMQDYADWCKDIRRKNERLLKAIKSTKGVAFHRNLMVLINETDINGQMEIVSEPEGKWQNEKYGREIKGYWVEQWSVGMEGDSYEGYVCVKITDKKYLKFQYSC